MVGVFVCKNDGAFELVATDVPAAALACWDVLKMHLARALYCEEELFAVTAAAEVALYRQSDGDNVADLVSMLELDGVDIADDAERERAQVTALVVPESRWVLDIFSSPMRRLSDLAHQTDHALRGVRKNSLLAPTGGRCGAVQRRQHAPDYAVESAPADCAARWCGLDSVLAVGRRTSALSGASSLHGAALNTTCALGNERLGDIAAAGSGAASAYQEPYIHIGTWMPLMVTDKAKPGLGGVVAGGVSAGSTGTLLSHMLKPATSEYEDVLVTTNRAREYISRFRRVGRPVTIHSIHTTLLPLAVASPNAISQQGPRVLYEGVYALSEAEAQRGFIQAVRLWFSFDCEQTVSVTKVHGALGLKPLRQQDGWIVVQALPGSPAFDAGMRGDEAFLTHVNGVDVSPHAFPAVTSGAMPSHQPPPSAGGQSHVSWKESVIPLVDKCETCIFTFF
ncbi:hypothetical protein PybrP1_009160 [[Pythium] brassicae (nom. inval.)]|nr:hypothetical protein PybrP1_009160 [[Pythium] brassicae (nom. inval.)]